MSLGTSHPTLYRSQVAYCGNLTEQQFLFREMRLAAGLAADGMPMEDVPGYVYEQNFFQYPTAKKLRAIAIACVKRLKALNSPGLAGVLAHGPLEAAKQVNLYAYMCLHRLVREFMVDVIGEKYRLHDTLFTRLDVNNYLTRLQEQNQEVAAWSDKTMAKIRQVLIKALVETGHLSSIRSNTLQPIFPAAELEQHLCTIGDTPALLAFNCQD